jgi:hypothetical protein
MNITRRSKKKQEEEEEEEEEEEGEFLFVCHLKLTLTER